MIVNILRSAFLTTTNSSILSMSTVMVTEFSMGTIKQIGFGPCTAQVIIHYSSGSLSEVWSAESLCISPTDEILLILSLLTFIFYTVAINSVKFEKWSKNNIPWIFFNSQVTKINDCYINFICLAFFFWGVFFLGGGYY